MVASGEILLGDKPEIVQTVKRQGLFFVRPNARCRLAHPAGTDSADPGTLELREGCQPCAAEAVPEISSGAAFYPDFDVQWNMSFFISTSVTIALAMSAITRFPSGS